MRRRLLLVAIVLLLPLLLASGLLVLAGLRETAGPAEVGLVLGNAVLASGRPSPRLQARLERTLELYRAHCFPVVIVSGGLGEEGFDEATVMADYLTARGVPRSAVIEDHHGVTTYATARFVAGWVPDLQHTRVLVVSQYFHLPRATLALRRFGVRNLATSPARYFEIRDFYAVPRELVGYLNYLVRSYPPPTRPAPPPA